MPKNIPSRLVWISIIVSCLATTTFTVLFVLSVFLDSISDYTGIFFLGAIIMDIVLMALVAFSVYCCNRSC